jgi:hypothetical protein
LLILAFRVYVERRQQRIQSEAADAALAAD